MRRRKFSRCKINAGARRDRSSGTMRQRLNIGCCRTESSNARSVGSVGSLACSGRLIQHPVAQINICVSARI